ncbi:2-amino-4-hydroxy-6-hydroxymethyldihydropteridine diphosphokinase [Parvibaculum sp.]|uniref:2-amino-4-hydroxy-6- hydroxymethyldihydropteridine diphosphokinase n=1 Tax=Parvibaculum sp. TaxID=2024848 RepID=UPI00391D368D
MNIILIALGANLPGASGGPEATLRAALNTMPSFGIRVVQVASFYRTPALSDYTQPDYVNSVAEIEAAEPPEALLRTLHRIESLFGRVRRDRWAPRAIDLDLLDYRGIVMPGGNARSGVAGMPIALPHPGISGRSFVLVPLREVAPGWRHPVSGESVERLIAALPHGELARIRRTSG